MFRYFFAIFFLGLIAVVALAGFRGTISPKRPIEIFPDMDDQPKYRPQHASTFFADGKEQRAPVPGTVPRGYSNPGVAYSTSASNSRVVQTPAGFSGNLSYADTGMIGEQWGAGIPLELDMEVMERGRERYNINCAICHGHTGAGNGIVKQYGLSTIASLMDPRIVEMPDGEIFNTITHGKNTMGAYGPNVTVPDRWAIIAYMRALQRSASGQAGDVPPEEMTRLNQPADAAAGGTQ